MVRIGTRTRVDGRGAEGEDDGAERAGGAKVCKRGGRGLVVDLECGAEVFLGAGNALLAFGGGFGLFNAFHALLDQRAEVLGLGGDKGGEAIGEDGGEGEHEGSEPVGDRGVGMAEAEDDGELGADNKGVTDGVGPDDGFDHTGADREDDGHKEEGEGGEEHKELGTLHGGCSRD